MERQIAQELDYGIAISTQAFIKALGMHWENIQRVNNGHSPAYSNEHFTDLIDEMGVHHNAVLERWNKNC